MANGESTKTSNQADADDALKIEFMSEPSTRGSEERDVEQLRASYATAHQAASATQKSKLDKELKTLDKVAAKYAAKLQKAAKDDGLDPDRLKADFQQIGQLEDPGKRQQQLKKFQETYAAAIMKVVDRVGVDRASDMRAAMSSFAVPDGAKPLDKGRTNGGGSTRAIAPTGSYDEGVIGGGWYIEPVPAPPPQPQYTQTVLAPPYELRATLGSNTAADTGTGRIQDKNEIWVGSSQHLASVGSTFFADNTIRRVRVETTVNLSYYTVIGAIFGYASAEVILNLKVLDGTRLMGTNRLSLLRQWGAVYWITSQSGQGTYTLSCEFSHSYGTPRTYAATAELETWTGGGGVTIISPATAYGSGTAQRITVTLIR